MCSTGGGHITLKKYAARWEIATDHFDPNYGKHRYGRERRTPLSAVLVEGSSFSRGTLKKRLYEHGLKDRRCELCGQGEMWRGKRMSLILDHTNGVRDDHRLENLRIVCPNCAATLSTHCGRNVPRERECRRCGTSFEPLAGDRHYCSVACSKKGQGLGLPRPERRKVERPSKQQLLADLEHMSYRAVGRKYGVSDNAVRKWLVWYERQAERERGVRAACVHGGTLRP
ncbi:MAG: hypothetical protein WD993_05200 [Thermoleophilaceae bacterium]